MRRILALSALVAITAGLLPAGIFAASADVRITEIMYDASGADTGREWVELWNGGNDAVTIVGGSGAGSWRFNDGANHTFTATAAQGTLTLSSGEFLIISANPDTFLLDHPGFSGNLVKSSFSLGNTSEILFLRIETAGTPWSEVSYTNSLAAGNGKTLEWNRDTGAWSESADVGGTPGNFPTGNSAPPPPPETPPATEPPPPPAPQEQIQITENTSQPSYDLTADLRISEFFPDPAGSDMEEWIEIWNPMSRPADLSGWKVDDAEGGSNPFEFPAGSEILPGAYLLLPRRQTSLQLNNDADSARLIRPDGVLKDEVAYGDAPEGSSYAKDGIAWKWTASPMPGAENVFPKQETSDKRQDTGNDNQEMATQEPVTENSESKAEKKESGIKNQAFVFEGVVTVSPGVFGTQYFYAENKSRGLQIYMYKKDFPDLPPGTRIRASGVMGVAYGEDRLKLSAKDDIVILGEEEILPEESAFEDLSDSQIGRLVMVSGEAIDKSKSGFILAEEDKELEIVWKKGAGNMPDVFPGDTLKVAGIVQKTKDGFRILPRGADDIEVTKKAEVMDSESEQKRFGFNPLVFAVAPLLALGAAFGIKKLGKKQEVGE